MKTICQFAALFACASSLDAQVAISLSRSSDGSTEIKVRNNSTFGLKAFAISASLTSANLEAKRSAAAHPPFVSYYDSAIDSTTATIPPNQERVLPPVSIICAPPMNVVDALRKREEVRTDGQSGDELFCELGQPIVAGVFDDGSSTGDAALLARLMLRRSNILFAIDTTLDALAYAGKHNIPRDQLVRQFSDLADSLNRWYLPPEQQVGIGLYESMAGKLRDLPKQELGAAFPPSAFVAQETVALKQRRATLWESLPNLAEFFPRSPVGLRNR